MKNTPPPHGNWLSFVWLIDLHVGCATHIISSVFITVKIFKFIKQ